MRLTPFTPPASRHVVVCDVHGTPWRVLDVVPESHTRGQPVAWARPPAPLASARAFVASVDGRKRVRVLDRHRTDPWDDLSADVLRGQLDDAYSPPPGWVRRHAHRQSVRSDLRYP